MRALQGEKLKNCSLFSSSGLLLLWWFKEVVSTFGKGWPQAAPSLCWGEDSWNVVKSLLYSSASCSNLRKGCDSVTYWSSGFTALQACIDAAIIQVTPQKERGKTWEVHILSALALTAFVMLSVRCVCFLRGGAVFCTEVFLSG